MGTRLIQAELLRKELADVEYGAGTEPRHVEAVRAKLKRLEERGWLRRNSAGMFSPLP